MNTSLNLVRRSLFLISMPMVFITFALPLRAEDLGASAIEIGVLYSLFTASLIVLRPLAGVGLDRIGRRPFFLAAMVFYLIANSVYAWSGALEGLYVARLFQGVGFSILSITTDTITADLTEKDGRSAAMGGNIASQTRGGMVGAFIGFGLVGAIPLHAWFYSFSTFAVVALLAAAFVYRAVPETMSDDRERRIQMRFAFSAKYYRLLLAVFLAAFAAAVIQPYYLIYLRGLLDLELGALAFAFLPVGVAYAILPVWLGKVANSLDRALAMSIGLTVAAGLYIIVPHITSFVWIIAAFTGAAVGSVLADLTKNAWIADIAGPNATGRTFGLVALVAGVGSVLGPLAGGAIYDGAGKPYIFYAAGMLLLVAAGLSQTYRAEARRS